MTHPVEIRFTDTATEGLTKQDGRIALLLDEAAKLPSKLPKVAREGLARALGSRDFQKLKPGQALTLAWPAGWSADSLLLVKLPRKASVAEARKAGATIGAGLGKGETLVLAGNHAMAGEVALGLALRSYDFSVYKTRKDGA